jgi:hypothetical protein
MVRKVSIPLWSGMAMSSSSTSQISRRAISSASRPVPASATTSKSSEDEKICLKPALTIW